MVKRIVVLLFLASAIVAQSPKVEAPVTYRLGPEASQVYLDLEKAKIDLAQKQIAIMIGAGIPASERDRTPTVKDGIVEFAPKPKKPE